MKTVCRLVFHCVIPVLLTVSVPLSYISKNNKYNKIQIFLYFCLRADDLYSICQSLYYYLSVVGPAVTDVVCSFQLPCRDGKRMRGVESGLR